MIAGNIAAKSFQAGANYGYQQGYQQGYQKGKQEAITRLPYKT